MKRVPLKMNLFLVSGFLCLSQGLMADDQPARLESVVLSTIPEERQVQIPILLGDQKFLLNVPSSLYYLSEEISVKREFPDVRALVDGLSVYCKESPDKHKWNYKLLTKN